MGKTFVFFGIVLFFLFVSHTNITSGGTCFIEPDRWFKYFIEFDKSTVPPGAELTESRDEYERHEKFFNFTGRYTLRNHSNIPLYLIQASGSALYRNPNTELPPAIIPMYKLISGKVYNWPLYYLERARWTYEDSYQVLLTGDVLEKLGIKIDNIKQDNRPLNTQPPSPQQFSFNAYYGTNPIQIKGVISYILNPDYDPKASVKRLEDCRSRGPSPGEFLFFYRLFPILFLSLLILIAGLAIYRFFKKKPIKILVIIFFVLLFIVAPLFLFIRQLWFAP